MNSASSGYVESIYPRGVLRLLSTTQDDVWDFVEKAAWDTYVFDRANEKFRYPTHGESIFYANPYHLDHFMNSYDPFQSYVSPVYC